LRLKYFKYSYNRFHKVYRVELFEHGKWRKCTYDRKNFEFLIHHNLKTKNEIRNFPYKPYFYYRIKWNLKYLGKWIKKTDSKIQKFIKSGFVILLVYFLGLITKCNFFNFQNNNQEDKKETIDKAQTNLNYKTLSDSLSIEIKKKELIIKVFESAEKDSTLTNEGGSLKTPLPLFYN